MRVGHARRKGRIRGEVRCLHYNYKYEYKYKFKGFGDLDLTVLGPGAAL